MPTAEEISTLLESVQVKQSAMAHYQQHASVLYVLEAKYTLFHVHRLLQNHKNSSLEKTLETFLKTRWGWLKNTDAQYFHDTQNPANLMCIEIAKMLERKKNKAYLLFLVPTLGKVPAFEYVASSYEHDDDDDDLAFNLLMLNDDCTRMMYIPEVLEFAEQDSVLKHTSLFNGKRCDLSIAEENRLLARHPSVENYYHAVRDKVNFQVHGETAGAYLMRLIVGLREGGSLGSGEEFQAGEEANAAIAEFSVFLGSLNTSTKRKLLKTGIVDRWIDNEVKRLSIAQSWALLINGSKEEEDEDQEERYCVELVAHDLEDILKDNPMLYQLMPFEQEGVGTLAAFQEAVTQAKTTMLDELNTSKTHRYFGAAGDDRFASDVLSKISRDRAFYLAQSEIAYVARCYHGDNQALKEPAASILLHTRDYMTRKSLREALKDLPKSMSRGVLEQVFPKPNDYLFYSTEQKKREKEEVSSDLERCAKKARHVHFSI